MISNPISGKADNVSVITAAEANAIGVACASAIDGVGGGTYTPSASITINGASGMAIGTDASAGLTSCRLTGTFTCTSSGTVAIVSGGSITIASGGSIAFTSGGNLSGTVTVPSGSTFNCASGSTLGLAGTVTQTTGAITVSDITMSGTANVKLTSRSITRVQHTPPVADLSSWTTAVIDPHLYNATVGTPVFVWLRVPHGATLNTVTVKFNPPAGHGGGLPATMPNLKAFRVIDSTMLQLGSTATDATAAGSYEATHTLSVTGIATVIDRTQYRYLATFTAEAGANSFVGTEFYETTVTYTTTAYDED